MRKVMICSRCEHEKPYPEFYENSRYSNGHQGVCKECQRKRMLELDQSGTRVEVYAKYRASEKGKTSSKRNRELYKQRHPEIIKAQSAVSNAISTGKLVRESCEICGDGKSEAHHDDYNKLLDVRFLCHKHHVEHHTQLRRAKGG